MADAFIGELRAFSFGFVPRGWAECNGQLLPVQQNQALFSLIGAVYGGDGRTTFGLPNLQGRGAIHAGSGYSVGAVGGSEQHTLSTAEMPAHTHVARAGGDATTSDPSGAVWAAGAGAAYGSAANGPMGQGASGSAGGSQPHTNMPPYMAVTYAICLNGYFPSRG